jgi:hypothetical protein
VPKEFKDSELLALAYQTENASLPGEIYGLAETLRGEIQIRRQVMEKTAKNLTMVGSLMKQSNPIYQEIIMGDKYEAVQVGAQGPNAHAHNIQSNMAAERRPI